MRIGPIPLPIAPTFIIRIKKPRDGVATTRDNFIPENVTGPRVNIAPVREPTETDFRHIDSHVE